MFAALRRSAMYRNAKCISSCTSSLPLSGQAVPTSHVERLYLICLEHLGVETHKQHDLVLYAKFNEGEKLEQHNDK